MSKSKEKMKTFMDDEFYMRPMVNQSELARHWKVSPTKVNEMVHGGLISLNKAGLISMKQIMEIEELSLDVRDEISIRALLREKDKLEKENEKLRKTIDSIKIELQVV